MNLGITGTLEDSLCRNRKIFLLLALLSNFMSRKNKKLTRKIDALQKEVVSLDSELYEVTQERDRLGLLLEEGE